MIKLPSNIDDDKKTNICRFVELLSFSPDYTDNYKLLFNHLKELHKIQLLSQQEDADIYLNELCTELFMKNHPSEDYEEIAEIEHKGASELTQVLYIFEDGLEEYIEKGNQHYGYNEL